MEKKLRAKLEEELKELRSEQRHFPGEPDNLDELRVKLREFEEKVFQLSCFTKKKYVSKNMIPLKDHSP